LAPLDEGVPPSSEDWGGAVLPLLPTPLDPPPLLAVPELLPPPLDPLLPLPPLLEPPPLEPLLPLPPLEPELLPLDEPELLPLDDPELLPELLPLPAPSRAAPLGEPHPVGPS
jgi:hypothetical protein